MAIHRLRTTPILTSPISPGRIWRQLMRSDSIASTSTEATRAHSSPPKLPWPCLTACAILSLTVFPISRREQRADMLTNHAPPLTIKPDASHLLWAWNFVRDAFLFWPYYKRDREHLRGCDVPSTDALHDKFVEVIKAARTYHLSYNAAIAHDQPDRLAAISVPTLLTCAREDMLLAYFDEIGALMPNAVRYVSGGLNDAARDATVTRFIDFLDDRPHQ